MMSISATGNRHLSKADSTGSMTWLRESSSGGGDACCLTVALRFSIRLVWRNPAAIHDLPAYW